MSNSRFKIVADWNGRAIHYQNKAIPVPSAWSSRYQQLKGIVDWINARLDDTEECDCSKPVDTLYNWQPTGAHDPIIYRCGHCTRYQSEANSRMGTCAYQERWNDGPVRVANGFCCTAFDNKDCAPPPCPDCNDTGWAPAGTDGACMPCKNGCIPIPVETPECCRDQESDHICLTCKSWMGCTPGISQCTFSWLKVHGASGYELMYRGNDITPSLYTGDAYGCVHWTKKSCYGHRILGTDDGVHEIQAKDVVASKCCQNCSHWTKVTGMYGTCQHILDNLVRCKLHNTRVETPAYHYCSAHTPNKPKGPFSHHRYDRDRRRTIYYSLDGVTFTTQLTIPYAWMDSPLDRLVEWLNGIVREDV